MESFTNSFNQLAAVLFLYLLEGKLLKAYFMMLDFKRGSIKKAFTSINSSKDEFIYALQKFSNLNIKTV